MAKKAYVGIIDYIQSTGTQYIDTGYKPNNNTRVVADIDFQPKDKWEKTFGTYGGVNSSAGKFFGGEYNGTNYNTYYGVYNNKSFSTFKGRMIWDWNKNVYKIGSASVTHNTSTFQSDYNIYIFAGSGYGSLSGLANMKLYYFQIYDNGTLVRDFVPAKDGNGVVCLYDNVTKKFYYNAGTGTFTAPTSYARKITDIYVGVNDVARKVKKAYVGVEGKARQFYGPTETSFSSCPYPTNFSVAGTAANATSTGTNTYGTWTIYMSRASYSTSVTYTVEKAFDQNSSTRARIDGSSNSYFYMNLPSGVSIKPSSIYMRLEGVTELRLEGYNEVSGAWDTLYSTKDDFTSSSPTRTASISTSNFYNKFRWYTDPLNRTVNAYQLEIKAGTIRKEN